MARRPERLAAFQSHFAESGLVRCIDVEPFIAYDGTQLDIESLRPRISRWNLAKLNEGRLRSIVGCALSHLEVWRRISEHTEPVIVFEDDARLASGIDGSLVASALQTLPKDAELVWLNDYSYGARANLRSRLRRKFAKLTGSDVRPGKVSFSPMPDVLTTAEAYMITPLYGRRLVNEIQNDIGAIDRHMQVVSSRLQSKVYQTDPPLFGQADRNDSDTGGH